jgi:phosphotransferase system HPr-like phosphotransfer protein
VLVSFALAALGLNAGGGLVLEAVGAAAAVALLALVLLLARAGHETAER